MLIAVQTSTAPKRKNTQTNCSISAAPTAMKTLRMASASRMPTSSTRCWWMAGTLNDAMMIMKMNRLSTLSEYSVMYPVKNSTPGSCPAKNHTPAPKSTAHET